MYPKSNEYQIKAPRHIYLDSLRGVMALVVMLSHFVYSFFMPALTFDEKNTTGFAWLLGASPLNIFINGNFAVCVFFILSGFVLSYPYYSKRDKNALKVQAFKRYPRLAPPVIFTSFLAYSLYVLGLFYHTDASIVANSQNWLGMLYYATPSNPTFSANPMAFLRDTFFGAFFLEGKNNWNPVLWTIHIEFFGSLMVFLLLYFFAEKWYRFLIYIVVAINWFEYYYFLFILGMILAEWKNTDKQMSSRLSLSLIFMGLFFGSFPTQIGMSVNSPIYASFYAISQNSTLIVFYHGLGAFLLLMGLIFNVRIQDMLEKRVLVFFGKISYSLYLVHVIVLVSLASYIFLWLNQYFRYEVSVMLTFLLYVVTSIVFAWMIEKYIDSRGVRFADVLASSVKERNI